MTTVATRTEERGAPPRSAPPRSAPPRSTRRRRAAVALGRLPGTAAVWLFTGFCLFAFAYLLLSSLKSSRDVLEHPWSPPTALHFENWSTAWNEGGFGPAFANSALLVVAAAGVTVVVAGPAAYVLGRRPGRVSNGLGLYFVLGLGIPVQVMVLPLYALMNRLGLIDSLFGLFVLYVVTSLPFTVFLLTAFFASLPAELEEAAALDGVSAAMTFWRIMLPLARGGLVTATLLNAMGIWNETLLALMFIQTDDRFTLPLALLNYFQQQQFTGADYGALFAGVSISILPMIGLYAWLGRRLTEGITMGAGK
ncbi:carbohydrate ABC transporter permease [Kitasatospora purpeofusca]|uniref:carbohydrate ABC transporter permease n=1 Tax=Kitasatospora purpeofusca TaxID=67352 RepID=UPI0035E27F48